MFGDFVCLWCRTLLPCHSCPGGTVTLDNSKGPYAIKLRVDSYALGIPTTEYLCAEQKEVKHLVNLLSVGRIFVNPATGGCASFTRTFDIAKPYTVPGTWLPLRNFTVSINSFGSYRVTE
jgi:hypothetical protein